MGRNRIRTDELTPVFIGYITGTFFGNRKVAYDYMNIAKYTEANISIQMFYGMLRGGDCSTKQVQVVEDCAIQWAREHSDPKLAELEASKTPRGNS